MATPSTPPPSPPPDPVSGYVERAENLNEVGRDLTAKRESSEKVSRDTDAETKRKAEETAQQDKKKST